MPTKLSELQVIDTLTGADSFPLADTITRVTSRATMDTAADYMRTALRHSNPNLLDNWYFADPINQRGLTEYTEIGYTIDRWSIHDGGIMALPGGKVIFSGNSASGYDNFRQTLERERFLFGCQYTLSFLYQADADDFILVAKNIDSGTGVSVPVFSTSGKAVVISMTFTPADTGKNPYVAVMRKNNGSTASIGLYAAKLELGDHQTLAYQDTEGNWVLNDPPPNRAVELAKCQRYQFAILQRRENASVVTSQASDTGANIHIPLPHVLRTLPAVSFQSVSLMNITNGNLTYPVTDMRASRMGGNVVKINITCDDGGLSNTGMYTLTTTTSEGYLILDANL